MQRWVVPKGPGTHVLMDGGILNVPCEDVTQFHEAYMARLREGHKLFVVEQKTDTFKFFVDLDYQGAAALTPDEVLDICHVLDEVVATGKCCIARAPPRRIDDSQIKSGVHVYWPDLHVTRNTALALRTRLLVRLAADHDRDWSKIIDASVYAGSGLRMIWSHKKPCGDPYVPWRILDGPDFGAEPSVEVLALFSVRVAGEAPAPSISIQGETPLLEAFIRQNVEGQHACRVKQATRREDGSWYIEGDSHYCEHIKTCHRSNHTWFSVHKACLTQRCHDEECKEFVGQEHILPPTVVEQLAQNVADLDSAPSFTILDSLPDGLRCAFGAIGPAPSTLRRPGAPVLGPRPRDVDSLCDEPAKVRRDNRKRPRRKRGGAVPRGR
jgi:hypothetical protein